MIISPPFPPKQNNKNVTKQVTLYKDWMSNDINDVLENQKCALLGGVTNQPTVTSTTKNVLNINVKV